MHEKHLVPVGKLRRRGRALCNVKLASVHNLKHRRLRAKDQPVVADRSQIRDIDKVLLTAVIIAQIVNRRSLVAELAEWQIQHLEQMHLSLVRKNADLIGILTGQHIAVLRIGRLAVAFIRRHVDRLRVAKAIHQEYHVHLLNLLLLDNRLFEIVNDSAPRSAILLFVSFQLADNHLCHRRTVA